MEGLLAEINAKKRQIRDGADEAESSSKKYKTRGEVEAEKEEEERKKRAVETDRRERLKAESRARQMRKEVSTSLDRHHLYADGRPNKHARTLRQALPLHLPHPPKALRPSWKLSMFPQRNVSVAYVSCVNPYGSSARQIKIVSYV